MTGTLGLAGGSTADAMRAAVAAAREVRQARALRGARLARGRQAASSWDALRRLNAPHWWSSTPAGGLL